MTHEEETAWRNSGENFEQMIRRNRWHHWPLEAIFYDEEADAYFDQNGDEL